VPLGKPPVVEAWIGFRFDQSASFEWNEKSAARFFHEFATDYPKLQMEGEHRFQVAHDNDNDTPRIQKHETALRRVRSFRQDQSRCLQLVHGQLVYSAMKTESSGYPGFEQLLAESLVKLAHYLKMYQPTAIRSASLFYKNQFAIAGDGNDGNTIDLQNYFPNVKECSTEPFGSTLHFSHRTVFVSPRDTGPLIQVFQPLEKEKGQPFIFEMTWLKICDQIDSLDFNAVVARLTAAHSYLGDCFEKSFTKKAWDLFVPE
jgi:uncharacterized protein (TIGR04255 family)